MKMHWLKKFTLPVLSMAFIYYLTNSGDEVATKNLVETITNQQNIVETKHTLEEYYEVSDGTTQNNISSSDGD